MATRQSDSSYLTSNRGMERLAVRLVVAAGNPTVIETGASNAIASITHSSGAYVVTFNHPYPRSLVGLGANYCPAPAGTQFSANICNNYNAGTGTVTAERRNAAGSVAAATVGGHVSLDFAWQTQQSLAGR